MPLAQVAPCVPSPALQDAAVEDRAGVCRACLYRYRGPAGSEVCGSQVIPHLVRPVADGGRVADAKLAVAVVTPALDAPVVQEGACVVLPRRNLGRGPAGSEVDGSEQVAHLVRPVTDLGVVADSQLTVVVPPPALDAAVVQQGAGVILAD